MAAADVVLKQLDYNHAVMIVGGFLTAIIAARTIYCIAICVVLGCAKDIAVKNAWIA